MTWGRLVLLALAVVGTVVACSQSAQVVTSTAQIKRAYWGLPQDGPGADVTSLVTCPGGYPCDVFANGPAYNDNRFDLAKRLTVIWTCQPQNFVLSEVATPSFKVRMACVGGAPAMAYIFGMPDRLTKTLRIRYTCNGQTTPARQATENSIADLRCEQAADLN